MKIDRFRAKGDALRTLNTSNVVCKIVMSLHLTKYANAAASIQCQAFDEDNHALTDPWIWHTYPTHEGAIRAFYRYTKQPYRKPVHIAWIVPGKTVNASETIV